MMLNWFRTWTQTVARWMGLERRDEEDGLVVMPLIEPVCGTELGDEAADLRDDARDAAGSSSGPAIVVEEPMVVAQAAAPVQSNEYSDAPLPVLDAQTPWCEQPVPVVAGDEPAEAVADVAAVDPAAGEWDEASEVGGYLNEIAPEVGSASEELEDVIIFPEPAVDAAVVAGPAAEAGIENPYGAAMPAEPIARGDAPIEIKPDGCAEPVASITFTELYDMIAREVDKRTDTAMGVYERLLGATRLELEHTRRSNRVAWTIGGVLMAIVSLGGIWSAGEVSANRVELTGLKQQVVNSTQVAAERDQLRQDVLRTRETSAKAEIDLLKSRLTQAMALSTDRDRLRGEIDAARRVRAEIETELKMVKTPVATQPVSSLKTAATPLSSAAPASTVEKPAMGSERPDVWSVLLNGKE